MLLLALAVNSIFARILPQLESGSLVIHVLGFFAILVPLVYLGPKVDAKDVFQSFDNLGGWSSNGLSWLVGINMLLVAFIGADAATHMAEEVEDSSSIVPKAMIIGTTINGVTGFGILIAALFSLTDLSEALSSPSGYPFMQILLTAVGSVHGVTAMVIDLAGICNRTCD